MVFNTGLFQSNKQTAMNASFINNLKKRDKKKILNSGSLQYPDLGLGKFAALVI